MPSSKRFRSWDLSSQQDTRSGLATVELAICLPMLVLIVFGSIQATNLIYLQHATTAAAYEGMLELARPNATNASVETRIQQVLEAREVVNTQIGFIPSGANISQLAPGNHLTIQVTADVSSNLVLSGFFISPELVMGTLVGTR